MTQIQFSCILLSAGKGTFLSVREGFGKHFPIKHKTLHIELFALCFGFLRVDFNQMKVEESRKGRTHYRSPGCDLTGAQRKCFLFLENTHNLLLCLASYLACLPFKSKKHCCTCLILMYEWIITKTWSKWIKSHLYWFHKSGCQRSYMLCICAMCCTILWHLLQFTNQHILDAISQIFFRYSIFNPTCAGEPQRVFPKAGWE